METADPQGNTGVERKTSDRILDAAEVLFSEQGFAGTAVRDIASQVQLNPASLYNHFPSKQALYEAVLERALAPIFTLLVKYTTNVSDHRQLEHLVEDVVNHMAANPCLPRLMQHEALTGKGMFASQTVGRTLQPLYRSGIEVLRQIPALKDWPDEDLQLFMTSYHHIIFGHFAMAPFMEEVLTEPPLSKEGTQRLINFLNRLLHCVMGERPNSG